MNTEPCDLDVMEAREQLQMLQRHVAALTEALASAHETAREARDSRQQQHAWEIERLQEQLSEVERFRDRYREEASANRAWLDKHQRLVRELRHRAGHALVRGKGSTARGRAAVAKLLDGLIELPSSEATEAST